MTESEALEPGDREVFDLACALRASKHGYSSLDTLLIGIFPKRRRSGDQLITAAHSLVDVLLMEDHFEGSRYRRDLWARFHAVPASVEVDVLDALVKVRKDAWLKRTFAKGNRRLRYPPLETHELRAVRNFVAKRRALLERAVKLRPTEQPRYELRVFRNIERALSQGEAA